MTHEFKSLIHRSSVEIIYQVFLVADLEIYPFAIAGQIEYVSVLGLCVLEMAGLLLADTGTIGPYEVMVHVVGYRKKFGVGDVNNFFSDQKMYSKGIVLNCVLRRDGT